MRDAKIVTILNAAGANGAGAAALVQDFRNLVLSLNSASNANMVIKFAGSIAEDCPNFGSAASPANQWDYIQVVDLEDGAAIDGDTGITLSGTDDQRQFEANTNGLRWITAIISSYSAGNVTVKARTFDNK